MDIRYFKPCWTKDNKRLLYYAIYKGDTMVKHHIAKEAKSICPYLGYSNAYIRETLANISYIGYLDGEEIPPKTFVLIDREKGLITCSQTHFNAFYVTEEKGNEDGNA